MKPWDANADFWDERVGEGNAHGAASGRRPGQADPGRRVRQRPGGETARDRGRASRGVRCIRAHDRERAEAFGGFRDRLPRARRHRRRGASGPGRVRRRRVQHGADGHRRSRSADGRASEPAPAGCAIRILRAPYFHRPLSQLLASGFRAGFVVDALEEPAFGASHATGRASLSWDGKFAEIPPALVVRMRQPAG